MSREPRSMFEQQLRAPDFQTAFSTWLAFAEAVGALDRFLTPLRSPSKRDDARTDNDQYGWRTLVDELHVGHVLAGETQIAITSGIEPIGRGRKKGDWLACSPSDEPVFVEVKSVFATGWRRSSRAWAEALHSGFRKALAKFSTDKRNLLFVVTHEPWPKAEEIRHFLFGQEQVAAVANDQGELEFRYWRDGRPPRSGDPRGKAHAHLRDGTNTRVGAVAYMHSWPNGEHRIVVYHNPWSPPNRKIEPEWLDPWFQVFAKVGGGTISFEERGDAPSDVHP